MEATASVASDAAATAAAMKQDCLSIVVISLVAAAFVEFINWILIYRLDEYDRMKKAIDNCEREKEKKLAKGGKDKAIKDLDKILSSTNQAMQKFKMKGMFVGGVALISVFSFLSGRFDGRAVAQLPFEPMWMIKSISRRGLPETAGVYDCAYPFMYLLASMVIRTNMQKILGFTPPKSSGAPSLWNMPEQKK